MAKQLKIDFVSDVTCPWCAIGLGALQQALDEVAEEVNAELHFQPFELNPHMGPEGQDTVEHLTQKYGSTEAQQAEIRQTICERGAQVGFDFNPEGRGRIWNTFDAHRLLHLAEQESDQATQVRLKGALLSACHTHSASMADHAVLLDCARQAGLDESRVDQVLNSDEFSDAVRSRQDHFRSLGISSVPAVIINDQHLISGGQPTALFVQALRQIAQESA